MLLIVLGVLIGTLCIVRVVKTNVKLEDILGFSMFYGFGTTVAIAITIIGIGGPLNGYHEPIIVQEYELTEIVENTGIYVIEDSDRKPFFKLKDSSNIDIYDESDLEIVVSDKYNRPMLVEYNRKTKKGIFGLGLFVNTTEYRIYTAEENVKRLK